MDKQDSGPLDDLIDSLGDQEGGKAEYKQPPRD